MSNIGDVIDFIDSMSEETLDANIAAFQADITKAQARIEVLVAIKRARGLMAAPAAPARSEEIMASQAAAWDAMEIPAVEVVRTPPPVQPAKAPPTPKPTIDEERHVSRSRMKEQLDKIHTWLVANGPANTAKIFRNTGVHFRRVARLLKDNPGKFRMHPNGDWEVKC